MDGALGADKITPPLQASLLAGKGEGDDAVKIAVRGGVSEHGRVHTEYIHVIMYTRYRFRGARFLFLSCVVHGISKRLKRPSLERLRGVRRVHCWVGRFAPRLRPSFFCLFLFLCTDLE